MQRILRALAVFAGVGIGSMLWFWLLYGGRRVVCGEVIQSLFVGGSTQLMTLAFLWAIIASLLWAFRHASPNTFIAWSFLLGSLFESFHQFSLNWLAGVNLSVSALLAIAIMQTLTLMYFYRQRLTDQGLLHALAGWGKLSVAGIAGILLTDLWLSTIPCQLEMLYFGFMARIVLNSVSWYLLCGVLPALITAVIYAGERQAAR